MSFPRGHAEKATLPETSAFLEGSLSLIISVVGNFDWHALISHVEACYGMWPSDLVGHIVTPYELAEAAQVVFVRPHLKQQTLLLSLPMIAADDPDYHAAHLAAGIPDHPKGSRC